MTVVSLVRASIYIHKNINGLAFKTKINLKLHYYFENKFTWIVEQITKMVTAIYLEV